MIASVAFYNSAEVFGLEKVYLPCRHTDVDKAVEAVFAAVNLGRQIEQEFDGTPAFQTTA